MRGFYIESIERKLLSYYDVSEVGIMLNNESDVVDFREVIIGEDVYENLADIDLAEFLEKE